MKKLHKLLEQAVNDRASDIFIVAGGILSLQGIGERLIPWETKNGCGRRIRIN